MLERVEATSFRKYVSLSLFPLIVRYRESDFYGYRSSPRAIHVVLPFSDASSGRTAIQRSAAICKTAIVAAASRICKALYLLSDLTRSISFARRHKALLCLAALLIAYRHNSVFSPRSSAPWCVLFSGVIAQNPPTNHPSLQRGTLLHNTSL